MTKKKYTTKENSPRCPRCGQAFPSSSILQNHINQPVSACRHIHENVMHFRTLESPTREYPSLNTPLPISRDGSPVANDSMDVDQPPGPSSEDDIPPKPAKYKYLYERQDFPGTAAIIGKGKTFMDNFAEDHYQHERELNLYYPFATREEWELSLFLLCSGLSVAAIDDFLQLEMIKRLNLSYKSAKGLRNRAEMLPSGPEWKSQELKPAYPTKNKLTLFYRDSVECIKALLISPLLQDSIGFTPFKLFEKCNQVMRVYTEWLSGDAAHLMQERLPKGRTLVAPVLSTDKTNISSMTGNRIAYPCLISLANISMDVRNKASNHLFLLLALLPVPKYLHPSKPINGMLAARLYHECMDIALDPVKMCARIGMVMTDALGRNRFCFTPLAALIVDTPESALASGVAGLTSSVTLAQYETFGDAFCHPSRTSLHTLTNIQAVEETLKIDPWNLEPFHKESKKRYRLNGVHRPFWRDWPLSDPSIFLTPEPLHHWHKMFWDHDAKWCIVAVGNAELDFRFSLLQRHTGYRHFKEGISLLKQVTGREHRDVQRYLVALIADAVDTPFLLAIRYLMEFRYLVQSRAITEAMCIKIDSVLQNFHAHKQAILDAGARQGKKNKPINNFFIPKLEFLQSVVHGIKFNGCAIQWSADTTEHAHIEVVKDPSGSSNNQRYEPQVCRFLNRRDKLRNFDLSTAIREARIEFRASSSSTDNLNDDSDAEDKETDSRSDHLLLDSTSELLSTIMPMTTFQSAKSNCIVDYFYKANLFKRGLLEELVPPRTFECSNNVVMHLSRDPSCKRLPIDQVADIFGIPDLKPALSDYISSVSTDLQAGWSNTQEYHINTIGGRRISPPNCRLPYSKLEVWHKARLQSTAYHYPHEILPPVTINAFPPSTDLPHGYYDLAIVNLNASQEWPHSGLKGHSVVDVHIIFRIVPDTPSTASPNITGRFLTYVQRFDIIQQPHSQGATTRGAYPEPTTNMYRLQRSKRANSTIMGGILPLRQLRALADLVPQLGKTAPQGLNTDNSHAVSTEFRLNKFFDKELYLALSL